MPASPTPQEISDLAARCDQQDYPKALQLAQGMSERYPHHPAGWKALGALLKLHQQPEAAIAPMQRAVVLDPHDREAHLNLALTLRALGRLAEAVDSYRRVLDLDPGFVECHNESGLLLHSLRRPAEAAGHFQKALALRPELPEVHSNLAVVLGELGQLAAAEASFQRALSLRPDYPQAHCNLGNLYREMGRLDDSENSYRRALALQADYPEARCSLAHTLLMQGRLQEGWPEYEHRWQGGLNPAPRPATLLPQWRGQAPGPGDGILVFAEQGLGDTVQFCRYLPLLRTRFDGRISMVVPTALAELLRHSFAGFAIDIFVSAPDDHSAWQWHCPLLSLPLAFGTTLQSIPANVPYLQPVAERCVPWQKRIDALNLPASTMKVGLVWKPGSHMKNAALRAVTLQQLSPLLNLPGVAWFSLQKEPDPDKTTWVENGTLVDWSADFANLQETAALAAQLDLVIAVDTGVAHLAAALGRPTWLLNRHASEWRWLRDRADSPWYPTMRLFNQQVPGQWDDVVEQLKEALMPPVLERHLQTALEHHRSGRAAEAEHIYRKILQVQPRHFDALRLLGTLAAQHQQPALAIELLVQALQIDSAHDGLLNNLGFALREVGRLDDALRCYDRALRLQPDVADTHNNRGLVLADLQRPLDALACFERAIALAPNHAKAHCNRGNVLRTLNRPEEAVASFARATELQPAYAEAHNNCGNALRALQRLPEALLSYERALAIRPGYPEALNNHGLTLLDLKRPDAALVDFDLALQNRPDSADVLCGRASALQALNRTTEALAGFDLALQHNPRLVQAWVNRGNLLSQLYQLESALQSYDKALVIEPDYPDALNNRGAALLQLKRPEEALACFARTLARQANHTEALINQGNALVDQKRLDEALQSFERALQIRPDADFLMGTWLHTKMKVCDWSNLQTKRQDLERRILAGEKASPPFPVLTITHSQEVIRKAAQTWVIAKCPATGVLPPIAPYTQPAPDSPPERIRVGYFSADFHNHATVHLMAEMLELHDKSLFELFAFSFGPVTHDPLTQSIAAAFDHFMDVRSQSDMEVARMARQLKIDIAVDLKGFTQDSRPALFALRLAPVQVNYLGYPGTMGAGYMDYLIADTTVAPVADQPLYAEQLVYLPDSYQVNDSRRHVSVRRFERSELGLPAEGFVFCCFNNNFKITPETFDSWIRILKQVPGSVLWLLEDNRSAAVNLRREAQARGLDPKRLVFAGRMNLPDHLARHAQADLFLDTLPCCAHTTASDALLAGLPVLTQIGSTFAGRVAASVLRAVGLPELVCEDAQRFEALAVALALHPDKLANLREKLARNRMQAPLFDTPRFTRQLEAAYRQMLRRYRDGLPPQSLHIDTQ